MASLTMKVTIAAKIIIDTDLFKIGFFFTILGTILSAINITAKLKMKIGNESNRVLSYSYLKNLVLIIVLASIHNQVEEFFVGTCLP